MSTVNELVNLVDETYDISQIEKNCARQHCVK